MLLACSSIGSPSAVASKYVPPLRLRDGWHGLPALPSGRAVVLAVPADGSTEALAADGSTLTTWQLTGQPVRWASTQSIKVPIQYGSSSSGD